MRIYLSSGSWGKLPDKASPGVSGRHSLLQQGFQNLPVRRSRFPLQNTSGAPFFGCLSQSTLGWWLVVSFISPAQGGAADRSLGAPARRVWGVSCQALRVTWACFTFAACPALHACGSRSFSRVCTCRSLYLGSPHHLPLTLPPKAAISMTEEFLECRML